MHAAASSDLAATKAALAKSEEGRLRAEVGACALEGRCNAQVVVMISKVQVALCVCTRCHRHGAIKPNRTV